MSHTDSSKNIYQRIHSIMADVKYIQKEDKKVNNQYTFVSHDAVTAKIRESMVSHGVVSIVSVLEHTFSGNNTFVKVQIEFVNIDQPEQKVVVCSFGQGVDNQDKGIGKAVSYAVKYGYLKTFALETGDDPERDMIERKTDADRYAELPDKVKDLFDYVATDSDLNPRYKVCAAMKWDVAKLTEFLSLKKESMDNG